MSERPLTCFFVKELYPIFSEGSLDRRRKDQVEQHLETCKECSAYYDRLQKGKKILERLSETEVSVGLKEYLQQEHHFWDDISKKIRWSHWPSALKWAFELCLLTGFLMSGIHYFPWVRLVRKVERMRDRAIVMAPIPQPVVSTPTPMVVAVATPPAEVAAPVVPTPKPTPIPTPRPQTKETLIVADEENSQTAGVEDSDQKATGFVWRGSLKVDDLGDDVAARVTKAIVGLGGTKAGQVELGWHRGNQRYYHFILPEENYEKLLSVLNREGLVELNMERHPRRIKEGHMRIIMTLEGSEGEN